MAENNTIVEGVDQTGNPVQSVDFDDDGNIVTTFQDGSTQVQDEDGNIITVASQSDLDDYQESLSNDYNNAQNIKSPATQTGVSELRGSGDGSDWRVRLRLAPQSNYLYNASDPGILSPLKTTDGIIFPYVPKIDTVHTARYSSYDLPHSNYRGYFYGGSNQEQIIINSTFTAQDTNEANYLLATIHFLRSCTKMFYGQDAQRGTPPPLVFLSGMGDYQYNEHPCVVSNVNINLPDDVDYIEAGDVGSFNSDFMSVKAVRSTNAPTLTNSLSRLLGTGLGFGGTQETVTYRSETVYQASRNGTTRVPTQMSIYFTLLPIQTRDQVSNEYSLKDYASGKLLKKGFH